MCKIIVSLQFYFEMHKPVLFHLAWAMEILFFNQNIMGYCVQTPRVICEWPNPYGWNVSHWMKPYSGTTLRGDGQGWCAHEAQRVTQGSWHYHNTKVARGWPLIKVNSYQQLNGLTGGVSPWVSQTSMGGVNMWLKK